MARKGQCQAKCVHCRGGAICGGGADKSMGTAVVFDNDIEWRQRKTRKRRSTHGDKRRCLRAKENVRKCDEDRNGDTGGLQ